MAVYKYTTPDFKFEVSQNEGQKANNSYKLSVSDNYDHSATFNIYNEDESFLTFLNKNVSKFKIGCFSDIVKHLADNGIQVEDIKVQMTEVDSLNIDLWHEEFEKMSKLWVEPHNDFGSVEFRSTVDNTKFKLTDNKNYSQFEFIYDDIEYKNRYDKEKDKYSEDFNNAEIDDYDYTIFTTLSYSKNNYETFVYDNIVKEEQLRQEIENSNPFRKTKRQMRDFVQSISDEIDITKNIKDTKQIDRLVENMNKREQKTYNRKEKQERVKNPKLKSKRRHNIEEPKVKVDFTTENDLPVIQIERSKNGVVEKLKAVINGKELETGSRLYKELLKTKSPSDVMEVLSKENITIKSFEADIKANIPELLPNITNVIKKEIAMYSKDIDINIKATAGDYSTISKITGDSLKEYEIRKKGETMLSIQDGVPVSVKSEAGDIIITKMYSNSNSQLKVDYLKPDKDESHNEPETEKETPETENMEKDEEKEEAIKTDTEKTKKQADIENINRREEMERKLYPNIEGIDFAEILNNKEELVNRGDELAYDKCSNPYIMDFKEEKNLKGLGDFIKINLLKDKYPKLFDENLTDSQKDEVEKFLNSNGLGITQTDETQKDYEGIIEVLTEFNDKYKEVLYLKKDPTEPGEPTEADKNHVNMVKKTERQMEREF